MDPYDVLGLGKLCTGEDIKDAYRERAKEVHPDKGGDAKKFALVKLAYDTLRDKKKRERFDKDGFVDDRGVSWQEGQAVGKLQGLFIDILRNTAPEEIEYTDIIGKLRNKVLDLMKKSGEGEKALRESSIATKKAIKILEKRLKRKGKKVNIMLLALQGIESGMQEQKAALIKEQGVLEEMMQMLKEFTYDFDSKPEVYESRGDRVMRMLGATYY